MTEQLDDDEALALVHEFRNSVTSDIEGVNGVAIGLKEVGSTITDELAIKVYVSRKRPESYLPAEQVLPTQYTFQGRRFKVDVVESGPAYALYLLSPADQVRRTTELETLAFDEDIFTDRYRPVPFGVSIGHTSITAGTMGCLVTDSSTGQRLVLSNNHVFAASNQASIGDPIVQPGIADDGDAPADIVATLHRFVPIDFSGANNRVDGAVALPTTGSMFTEESAELNVGPIGDATQAVGLLFAGNCGGRIWACRAEHVASSLDISFDGGHALVTAGDHVSKVGRTTGWTNSQVIDAWASIPVNFGNGQVAEFTDLLTIPEMGHGGDSGSIIFKYREGTS